MERNLMKECEQILKMEKPQRSQSTCKLQVLAPNLFFLKQKVNRPSVNPLPRQRVQSILTNTVEDNSQPVSIMKVNSFNSEWDSESSELNLVDRKESKV